MWDSHDIYLFVLCRELRGLKAPPARAGPVDPQDLLGSVEHKERQELSEIL